MADVKFSVETEVYVGKREHCVCAEVEVCVYEDGIGEYECHGHKCYDHGKVVKELNEIFSCELERCGWVDSLDEVPAFAKVIGERDGKYLWSHKRRIEPNDEIIDEINDYVDWIDVNDYIDDREYEAQMAQRERAMWSEE